MIELENLFNIKVEELNSKAEELNNLKTSVSNNTLTINNNTQLINDINNTLDNKIDKTEFDTTITNYVTTSDLNNTLVERVVMPVISMTKSLKLSSANTWYDTGIDTTSGLESGTYLMQVYINNGSNTGQYNEYFSGIISWHSGTTNSSNSDIIYLSKAGHARNNSVIVCY